MLTTKTVNTTQLAALAALFAARNCTAGEPGDMAGALDYVQRATKKEISKLNETVIGLKEKLAGLRNEEKEVLDKSREATPKTAMAINAKLRGVRAEIGKAIRELKETEVRLGEELGLARKIDDALASKKQAA